MRSHQSAAAGQVLTVQTSRSTEKRFRTGAKHEPPPVVAILGVGSEAYSAARGAVLLVWQKNIAIGFYFAGVYPAPQAAKSLAAAALKRL